jgi:cytoskeletal protein CcmA (bactofilin family)
MTAAASNVTGDELRFEAVNPTTIPSGIASVQLLMANVPEFTIINEASEAPSARVFVSNGAITIDRSKHSASKGDLHSNATITFKKGDPTTFTGNLSAVGSITINKDNTIVGNATSASTITVASGGSITGTRTPNANVASLPITATSFSAGGANITVPKNGTRTLSPGSYGNVILNNSATLNLSSGEYRFVKLETGSSCFLNFNVSNGGVQVKVTTSLKFGAEVTVAITPGGETNSVAVDFITLQTAQVLISKEGFVLGTITAPNAEVFVGKNTSLRGAILANKITVDRDVIFWHHSIAGTLPIAKASVADEEATSNEQPVTSYQLEQNYPNPFNPSTTIRFALPEAGEVSLRIYNLQGQLVREVVNSLYESGRHAVVWDGKDAGGRQVASGVYVYRLKAGAFVAKRKLVLMK